MKKNWLMWVIGAGALYLLTKKKGSTTSNTEAKQGNATESSDKPDLGNQGGGATKPNDFGAGKQASTPPVILEKDSNQTVNTYGEEVLYASTSPSLGTPKEAYTI
jgi:hypothetical protein